MRAAAHIVAETDGRNGTRLAVLRGESPLLLRRTGPRDMPGVATVHLVGGAAGPLRGDDLRLDIEVGPGARLHVRSVAASLALPGKPGAPPSRVEIHARVAAGATLHWMPEPLIAVAGCHHLATTDVRVAAGGTVLWRDDLVCGRHDEPAGDVRTDLTVRYGGSTLYRHELAIGPAAPGWSGPAVLGATPGPAAMKAAGGGWAIGAVLVTGPDLPTGALPGSLPAGALLGGLPAGAALGDLPAGGRQGGLAAGNQLGCDAAIMPLAGPGMLATAIGVDIRSVRAALDPLCASWPAYCAATHRATAAAG